MARLAILLLAAAAAFGADDPWTKVKELRTGTEIRVLKKGSTSPVLGVIYEANDDNLILVVKKEQIAIAKNLIDRLDYRPARPRTVRETTVKKDDGIPPEPRAGMNGTSTPSTGYSTNSSVSFQGKGDFETIYRREPAPPKK